MVTCSVSDCGVNNRNNPENCTFHRFPLDSIIRKKWLRLIGRVDWNPEKNSTICSKHFIDKYERKNRRKNNFIKMSYSYIICTRTDERESNPNN